MKSESQEEENWLGSICCVLHIITSGPEQLMPTIIFQFIWCKVLSRTVLEKLNLLFGLLEVSIEWSQAVVWLYNLIWPDVCVCLGNLLCSVDYKLSPEWWFITCILLKHFLFPHVICDTADINAHIINVDGYVLCVTLLNSL